MARRGFMTEIKDLPGGSIPAGTTNALALEFKAGARAFFSRIITRSSGPAVSGGETLLISRLESPESTPLTREANFFNEVN
jgi:hypothetical protein